MIDPIVILARLIHTPRLWDYGACHISRHLPKTEVARIEKLYKNKTIADITQNAKLAEKLFAEYLSKLESKLTV